MAKKKVRRSSSISHLHSLRLVLLALLPRSLIAPKSTIGEEVILATKLHKGGWVSKRRRILCGLGKNRSRMSLNRPELLVTKAALKVTASCLD